MSATQPNPASSPQREERWALAYQSLRQRAEQILRTMEYSATSKEQPAELAALYQDLMVFHIELDLQQDELFQSRQRVEDLLKENFIAFELAPFYYWKVDQKGFVHHWNLLGAEFFKTPRRNLQPGKIPFSIILDPVSHQPFGAYLRSLFSQEGVSTTRVQDRSKRPLHLFGRRLPDTSPTLALLAGMTLEESSASSEEKEN